MTPNWFVRPLRPGDQGEDVKAVQLLLRCDPTGQFDETTAAKVRGYKRLVGMEPTAEVDRDVAERLGEVR